jgi:hypothetical protein
MALNDLQGEPVTSGTWLYDGSIRRSIHIVARNYDLDWAVRYGDGHDTPAEGEVPMPLNDAGVIYYVEGTGPGFHTVEEAKAWADQQPWGPVTWD